MVGSTVAGAQVDEGTYWWGTSRGMVRVVVCGWRVAMSLRGRGGVPQTRSAELGRGDGRALLPCDNGNVVSSADVLWKLSMLQ